LQQAGYSTAHFGKWHVGSVQEGSPVNPSNSGFDQWLSAPNFFDQDPILSRNGVAVPLQGESSDVVVSAAIDFLRQQDSSEQPFLMVVWFAAPHDPHVASQQDSALYPQGKFQNYFAEITAMDRAVGKLREELRKLQLRDNTILWFHSDNGGLDPRSSGGRAKKGSIYEGGLRVPALLEWPAALSNARVTQMPCFTSDIYPTLLELADVQVQDQLPLDGISLVPLLRGQSEQRSKPLAFWRHPTSGRATFSHRMMEALLHAQQQGTEVGELGRLDMDAAQIQKQYPTDSFPGHAAWLDWPWKLHRLQTASEAVEWELYNLLEDPMELDNRLATEADRAAPMQQQLERWQVSVIHSLNGRDYVPQ